MLGAVCGECSATSSGSSASSSCRRIAAQNLSSVPTGRRQRQLLPRGEAKKREKEKERKQKKQKRNVSFFSCFSFFCLFFRLSFARLGIPASLPVAALIFFFFFFFFFKLSFFQRELAEEGLRLGAPIFIRAFKYGTSKLYTYVDQFLVGKARRSSLNQQYLTDSVVEIWVEPSPGQPYKLFKSYPTCVYSGGLGPKKKEGDLQTPEGFYTIVPSAFNPTSAYRLVTISFVLVLGCDEFVFIFPPFQSFNVGYPNAYDRALSYTGGAVMVHGYCGR